MCNTHKRRNSKRMGIKEHQDLKEFQVNGMQKQCCHQEKKNDMTVNEIGMSLKKINIRANTNRRLETTNKLI